jgi:hypothetical protein
MGAGGSNISDQQKQKELLPHASESTLTLVYQGEDSFSLWPMSEGGSLALDQ